MQRRCAAKRLGGERVCESLRRKESDVQVRLDLFLIQLFAIHDVEHDVTGVLTIEEENGTPVKVLYLSMYTYTERISLDGDFQFTSSPAE